MLDSDVAELVRAAERRGEVRGWQLAKEAGAVVADSYSGSYLSDFDPEGNARARALDPLDTPGAMAIALQRTALRIAEEIRGLPADPPPR